MKKSPLITKYFIAAMAPREHHNSIWQPNACGWYTSIICAYMGCWSYTSIIEKAHKTVIKMKTPFCHIRIRFNCFWAVRLYYIYIHIVCIGIARIYFYQSDIYYMFTYWILWRGIQLWSRLTLYDFYARGAIHQLDD